jgi:hypothetical protein
LKHLKNVKAWKLDTVERHITSDVAAIDS